MDCKYYYYFNEYGQYRCTETDLCPDGMFLIKNKKKCINECKNDFPYIYQFKNQCIDKCPQNTIIKNDESAYEDSSCLLFEET